MVRRLASRAVRYFPSMGAKYLNTDLIITKRTGFETLVEDFNRVGLFQLDESRELEGARRVTFETEAQYANPSETADRLLLAISQLRPGARQEWDKCLDRHIDVGYECSEEPFTSKWEFEPELLNRIAAVNAKLVTTIYRIHHAGAEVDGE
jgi:hypothetical protein